MSEEKKDLMALVIDDEKDLLRMYTLILKRRNCEVDSVETCEEGIKKFEANPEIYDLVITDLNQQPKSGIDVVEAVRVSNNPNIPVYIVTGFASPDLEKRAIELVGEDRYLKKPIFDTVKITEEARQIKYRTK